MMKSTVNIVVQGFSNDYDFAYGNSTGRNYYSMSVTDKDIKLDFDKHIYVFKFPSHLHRVAPSFVQGFLYSIIQEFSFEDFYGSIIIDANENVIREFKSAIIKLRTKND